MFPTQMPSGSMYSDGQKLYQHLDLVIYLSDKPCFVCQDTLEGVVDDFTELQSGCKVSFCHHCKQKLCKVV
jgi:hypothetical protein